MDSENRIALAGLYIYLYMAGSSSSPAKRIRLEPGKLCCVYRSPAREMMGEKRRKERLLDKREEEEEEKSVERMRALGGTLLGLVCCTYRETRERERYTVPTDWPPVAARAILFSFSYCA
jgi:hypothetical protein